MMASSFLVACNNCGGRATRSGSGWCRSWTFGGRLHELMRVDEATVERATLHQSPAVGEGRDRHAGLSDSNPRLKHGFHRNCDLVRARLARAQPLTACRAMWPDGLKIGARPSPSNVPCWPDFLHTCWVGLRAFICGPCSCWSVRHGPNFHD